MELLPINVQFSYSSISSPRIESVPQGGDKEKLWKDTGSISRTGSSYQQTDRRKGKILGAAQCTKVDDLVKN
eukprot:jgi/Psemu1/62292/gm1.62292_g